MWVAPRGWDIWIPCMGSKCPILTSGPCLLVHSHVFAPFTGHFARLGWDRRIPFVAESPGQLGG